MCGALVRSIDFVIISEMILSTCLATLGLAAGIFDFAPRFHSATLSAEPNAPTGAQPQDAFNYIGPMSQLLAEGASHAPASGGLPFRITIQQDGSVQADQTFGISKPDWKGGPEIVFTNLRFTSGTLQGEVRLRNASSLVFEGLRLDVSGASEAFRTKDAAGKEVVASRAQSAQFASPLHFGDLQTGESTATLPFAVSGLQLQPDTQEIVVSGGLSGLALVRRLNPVKDLSPVSIDLDASGNVYLVGSNLEALYRCDGNGAKSSAVASLPSAGIAVAVERPSGPIVVGVTNGTEFLKYSSSGADAGRIPGLEETRGFSGWTGKVRYGQDGKLYVNFGDGVARLSGTKPEMIVTQVGSYEFESYLSFDVASDGAMWVGTRSTVFRIQPDGKSGKRIVDGPSAQPGKLSAVLALRLDRTGLIYVAEDMGAERWPRISVFDSQGRLVRIFGRGAQRARQEAEDFRPGEIVPGPVDFAFDSSGRLYLVHAHLDQPLLVFEPF